MVGLDTIRNIARRSLVIRTPDGTEDLALWEHSQRVANSAADIAQLEQAADSIDEIVLTAAAYYHEAGWIVQYRDGRVSREQILARITTSVQRELGAVLMEQDLADHLPRQTLTTASDCIRKLNNREVDILEARLIVDADSLEECGALSLWHMVRKHTFDGKGLEGILESWETKKQYNYWDALINDSIYFESVRHIARQRLTVLDNLIAEVRKNHYGDDIRAAIAKKPPYGDVAPGQVPSSQSSRP